MCVCVRGKQESKTANTHRVEEGVTKEKNDGGSGQPLGGNGQKRDARFKHSATAIDFQSEKGKRTDAAAQTQRAANATDAAEGRRGEQSGKRQWEQSEGKKVGVFLMAVSS